MLISKGIGSGGSGGLGFSSSFGVSIYVRSYMDFWSKANLVLSKPLISFEVQNFGVVFFCLSSKSSALGIVAEPIVACSEVPLPELGAGDITGWFSSAAYYASSYFSKETLSSGAGSM